MCTSPWGHSRVPDCDLSSAFSAGLGYRNGTLKPGWQVTVDWELELGMGTTAVGGDSRLMVETFVPPTPSP